MCHRCCVVGCCTVDYSAFASEFGRADEEDEFQSFQQAPSSNSAFPADNVAPSSSSMSGGGPSAVGGMGDWTASSNTGTGIAGVGTSAGPTGLSGWQSSSGPTAAATPLLSTGGSDILGGLGTSSSAVVNSTPSNLMSGGSNFSSASVAPSVSAASSASSVPSVSAHFPASSAGTSGGLLSNVLGSSDQIDSPASFGQASSPMPSLIDDRVSPLSQSSTSTISAAPSIQSQPSSQTSSVPPSSSSGGDGDRKSVLPGWCRELHLAPTLYQQIFLKCCPKGQKSVDTHLIYPILVASGLPRSTLKDIWTKSNRMTAGKLNRIELYIALGLVALAQV